MPSVFENAMKAWHSPEGMPGLRIRDDGKYFAIWCEGCGHVHGPIALNANGRTHGWDWNPETKTISPSVRHFHPASEKRPEQTRCHYNITEGKILYHGDCFDHDMRGTYEMDKVPHKNYGGIEMYGDWAK